MRNLNILEYKHGGYLATRVRNVDRQQGDKICMPPGRFPTASCWWWEQEEI